MVQVKQTLSVDSYKRFSAALQAYKKSGEFTSVTQCLVDVFGAEKRNHALLYSEYFNGNLFICSYDIKLV